MPIFIAGKSVSPPEDCGGIPGYYNLMEILSNPKDPEYKETKKWFGLGKNEQWNVKAFDIKAINAQFEVFKL